MPFSGSSSPCTSESVVPRRVSVLETLVDGALPREYAALLRELDGVRLGIITRPINDLARRGGIRVRPSDAIAYPRAPLLSRPGARR